jgi:hypothetical protein
MKKQLDAKDVIITALQADKKILMDRNVRLEGDWKKCESDLISAESAPIWPYVVGAIGAVVGAVGVGAYLGSRR